MSKAGRRCTTGVGEGRVGGGGVEEGDDGAEAGVAERVVAGKVDGGELV